MAPAAGKTSEPTKARPRPATFDHLVSQKKPVRIPVDLVLDNEVAERVGKAKTAVETARLKLGAQRNADNLRALESAEADLEAAREEAMPHVVTVVVGSIGRHRYESLQKAHPPTDEQLKEAERLGKEAEVNTDTFPPSLIAACSVEPKLSPDQVLELWNSEDWNVAELMSLYFACVQANQTRPVADLGKGSGPTRG